MRCFCKTFSKAVCPTNAVTGIPADLGYPNLEYDFNKLNTMQKKEEN